VCHDLATESLLSNLKLFGKSKADLHASSSLGCMPCTTILEGICKFWPEWGIVQAEDEVLTHLTLSGGLRGPLVISLEFDKTREASAAGPLFPFGNPRSELEIYALPGDKVSCVAFGRTQHVPRSLHECTRKIPQLLSRCTKYHSGCRETQAPMLPTRVIDLGVEGSGHYRLLETADMRASYTCLSYCWGGEQEFKTTRATLSEMKQRISWDDLPPLFRSAANMTIELGIRYLWIDCLCIVQDDFKDWARESGSMASVYGEATLVLVAAAARSPADGFFYNASPADGPFALQYRPQGGDGAAETVYIRRRPLQEHCTLPLKERAWTFQEGWLARRVVQFSTDGVSFTCRTDSGDEEPELSSTDVSATTAINSNPYDIHYYYPAAGYAINPKKLDIFFDWPQIVEEYSARKLTKDSDRLPAISGIARRFQQDSDAFYLAGLWSYGLVESICWYSPLSPRRRPSQPRGPSWSWVAIEGAIRHPKSISLKSTDEMGGYYNAVQMGYMDKVELRIMHAACELTTSDTTGSVSGGFMILHGFLAAGAYRHGGEYRYPLDINRYTPYHCYRKERDVEIVEPFYADFSETDYLDTEQPRDGDILYLLKIGLVAWPLEPPCKFRALVVRRTKSCQACFERVGFIESSVYDDEHWFKDSQEQEIRLV